MNLIAKKIATSSKLILFLIFSCLLNSKSAFSQWLPNVTDYISLTLTHSRRIPYNNVRVEFIRFDSDYYVTVMSKALDNNKEFKSSTFYRHYNSDRSKFNALVGKLKKLEELDLSRAITLGGKDGINCSLSFGTKIKTHTFNCWTPQYETKERGLTEYYTICKELIKLAKLKEEDVF